MCHGEFRVYQNLRGGSYFWLHQCNPKITVLNLRKMIRFPDHDVCPLSSITAKTDFSVMKDFYSISTTWIVSYQTETGPNAFKLHHIIIYRKRNQQCLLSCKADPIRYVINRQEDRFLWYIIFIKGQHWYLSCFNCKWITIYPYCVLKLWSSFGHLTDDHFMKYTITFQTDFFPRCVSSIMLSAEHFVSLWCKKVFKDRSPNYSVQACSNSVFRLLWVLIYGSQWLNTTKQT